MSPPAGGITDDIDADFRHQPGLDQRDVQLVPAFHPAENDQPASMQRATESSSGGHTGPTWRCDYSAATPSDAGTTTVRDPDGDETIYTHNADGEVTKVTDPLGHSRHSTYKNHLTQTAIDAMGTGTDGTGGNTTTYGWDGRDNAITQKLPMGATASVTAYQTIAGTDLPNDFTTADGRKDSFKYDANGNTMSVTTSGTAGGTPEYTYNKATPNCGGFEGQRCTAEDGNGKVTSFTYDDHGNLWKVKPPAPLGETTYYDALGRVETVKNGRDITTVYTYDNRDRVREVSSTNSTVIHTYDGDGNVKTRTDASGTTTWEYDKLNREKRRTLQNDAQTVLAYTPGDDVDFSTDPTGKTDYTCCVSRTCGGTSSPGRRGAGRCCARWTASPSWSARGSVSLWSASPGRASPPWPAR
ncbi:hypothetical protein [Streptomyces sp. NPDC047829]|uniref:hypothetical protein n=1 Tax=Streptomyces sp. NPDC047829 TaxID=3154609 RepID=UPI003410060A